MAQDPTSDRTRPSLLLRIRDPADAEAWSTFVDVFGPLVYGYCRRRGLKNEDAEDITQRVFAQVAQSIRSFDYAPEKGRFRDWLGTAVRHEIGRYYKRGSRQPSGVGMAGGEDWFDQVEASAQDTAWSEEFTAHVLQAALARCQPHFEHETWRAFEQVWVEKQQPADVAIKMQRPIDWVYVAKSRVLKRLWEEVTALAENNIVPGRVGQP